MYTKCCNYGKGSICILRARTITGTRYLKY
jgi:hypothetical protein